MKSPLEYGGTHFGMAPVNITLGHLWLIMNSETTWKITKIRLVIQHEILGGVKRK